MSVEAKLSWTVMIYNNMYSALNVLRVEIEIM